ncbi:MAG: hypothetical protein ACK2UQ_05365, partial [Anaerolineae bacterium]
MEKSGLLIKSLAENKKVIPIYFKNEDVWNTSIKLPDIVLSNSSESVTCTVEGIELLGFAGGKHIVTFRQDKDEIENAIAKTNHLLNRLTQKPASQWREYNLHMLFGDVPMPQDSYYEESNQLKPHSMTCLRLQDLFCFQYAGMNKIDEIICEVTVTSGTDEIIVKSSLSLTPYRCTGDYIFPIEGSVTIMGTPWNQILGHRIATSQEFAIDVVDYRRDENGEFVLSSPPNSSHVKDYFLFEREVLAIGDGVVVAAGNQWPNAWVENPLDYSEERIVELTEKLLQEGM